MRDGATSSRPGHGSEGESCPQIRPFEAASERHREQGAGEGRLAVVPAQSTVQAPVHAGWQCKRQMLQGAVVGRQELRFVERSTVLSSSVSNTADLDGCSWAGTRAASWARAEALEVPGRSTSLAWTWAAVPRGRATRDWPQVQRIEHESSPSRLIQSYAR